MYLGILFLECDPQVQDGDVTEATQHHGEGFRKMVCVLFVGDKVE